jgi:hypothetical protein
VPLCAADEAVAAEEADSEEEVEARRGAQAAPRGLLPPSEEDA